MQDFIDTDLEDELKKLMRQLTNISETQIEQVVQLVKFLVENQDSFKIENLTCRNIIRFIEWINSMQYESFDFEDLIWAAYKLTFEKQIKNIEIIGQKLENINNEKAKKLNFK